MKTEIDKQRLYNEALTLANRAKQLLIDACRKHEQSVAAKKAA